MSILVDKIIASRSPFVRHNIIFFSSSIAVGALNYLYYPILGRLLSPSAFGEVQALVSFFLQLSIFLTVLGLVTVNIAANYSNKNHRNDIIFELERVALGVSALLLLVSIIFRYQLQHFFRFSDPLPFVILVLAVVVSVPFTFRSSYIRGRQGFGVVSLANLLASAAKIVLSASLVIAGLGTAGAIWGVTVAQCIAFLYTAYWARRMGLFRDGRRFWQFPDLRLLAPELKYSGIVLVASLIITLQFSIDILVVKHYFDARVAGLYAGVATVARIIFFLTGSISQVLMPSVKLRNSTEENLKLFRRSFYMLAAVSTPALLLFVLDPGTVVRFLMGSQYVSYAYLLPLLSIAIFAVSIVNLMVSYYMALRRYSIAVVTVLGGAITYALMIFNHSSLNGVIMSLLIGSVSMILLVAGLSAGQYAFKRRKGEQAL